MSRVRPLLSRPGARYACLGDGLCCTDVHLLGPLTPSEVKRLHVLAPKPKSKSKSKREPKLADARVVVRSELLDAHVIATTAKGECRFLLRDAGGCYLHVTHGAAAKPAGCRRFPYRLVATPTGGRVTTEHRCPCRTMGPRPPLSLADAENSLRDDAGRLQADARVGESVRERRGKRMTFRAYTTREATWIARLLAGDDPGAVLDAEPLPHLQDVSWIDVAHQFRSKIDGSACGDALAWFGDVLLGLADTRHRSRGLRARPWSPSFDRAEKRVIDPARASDLLGDFAADVLWSLEWVQVGSLEVARKELVTRMHVARTIVNALVAAGTREERAAAEAIAIVELAGASGLWGAVTKAMEG